MPRESCGALRRSPAPQCCRSPSASTPSIPIVEGRDFDERDLSATPIAIALNQAAARKYFGSQSPIGRSIFGDEAREYRVIAIVQDGRYNTLRDEMDAVTFVPYPFAGRNKMTYAIKTAGDAPSSPVQLQHLLDAARAVDPLVPLEGDRLDAVLARSLGQERLLAIIATLFGLMALMLMALGLYGLMACWVTSRTPEIGVRLALGARRRQVVWDVVRLPFTLVGAGLLLGIGVTVAGTRFVSHLLYGLTPEDPATLSASIAFLAVVAATAATFPARRACRIDPVVALRTE